MGDRDIRLTWSTSPAGVARWHSAAAFHRPRQEFLRTPHTDQLRRMVAIADRSPARYIFELKLAEVPSGPLNSKLMMFRPRPGQVSRAIARTADSESYGYRRGFLRSRSVLARLRSRTTRMAEAWSMALPRACAVGQEGGACAGRLPSRLGEWPTRTPL